MDGFTVCREIRRKSDVPVIMVVGPGLQPRDDVVAVGARGDHDDRHVAHAADLPAHGEPVGVGEHQSRSDDVWLLRDLLQPSSPVAASATRNPRPECQAERSTDTSVVLDQQHGRLTPQVCAPAGVHPFTRRHEAGADVTACDNR